MVQAASRGGGRKALKTDVAIGNLYEISHEHLPPQSPFWLRSIQVVMVGDKNRCEVTLNFPSKQSLDNYLSRDDSYVYPDLDMSYKMKMKLVQKVLVREVTYPEINNLDDLKAFWMANTFLVPKLELEEVSTRYLSLPAIDSDEDVDVDEVDEIDDKNALGLVVKQESVDEEHIADDNRKRKRFRWWSYESFANGEKVILRILKEKNAVYDKEIVRPALRKEAQKEIGNTGLLDHLLKDIPGRITPDHTLRFQRRHNHQGELIYWLESAELADIRKKAGVEDPSWIPSSCWKQGGCSAGCPRIEELEKLKEDLSEARRELEEAKRQLNEVRNADLKRDCNNWAGGFW